MQLWATCVVQFPRIKNMALFESASKQVVKDTGRSSLHPVLDLNSSSQCRVMCVVERKKSRWLWKSVKYLPTPFTLNEILTKPIDVSDKIKIEEFVSNYANDPTLHVSGKLGAKLAKELGIDISTTDSFVVKMDLGTLNKTAIRWQDLNDALKNQTLNLDHEFVQAVLNSKRRKLCIISEIVTTTNKTNIQSELQVQAGADMQASCFCKVSVNLDSSFQDTHHRSFDVPKDTVMAYGCYELIAAEGLGEIELAIDKRLEDVVSDSPDGSAQVTLSLVLDQPDGADSALTSAFNALMNSPKEGDIIQCFREILVTPDCLAQIEDLLDDACDSFEKQKVKPYTYDALKSSLGSCNGWERLLMLLGFSFDSKKGGKMVYPEEDYKEIVFSCSGLAAALHGLTSIQCFALKDLQPEYCDQLLYLIRNAMYGRNTPADDPQLKRIYTHMPNSGKSFLLALGFRLVTEKGKDTLALPSDHMCPLEDAYVAIFVMASK